MLSNKQKKIFMSLLRWFHCTSTESSICTYVLAKPVKKLFKYTFKYTYIRNMHGCMFMNMFMSMNMHNVVCSRQRYVSHELGISLSYKLNVLEVLQS